MIHDWQSNHWKNNGNQLKPAGISSPRLRINRKTLTLHMPRPLKQVKEINCDWSSGVNLHPILLPHKNNPISNPFARRLITIELYLSAWNGYGRICRKFSLRVVQLIICTFGLALGRSGGAIKVIS